MLRIKSADMKFSQPLTECVEAALKGGYSVCMVINGEWYDVTDVNE